MSEKALLSVTNKDGLLQFSKDLIAHGFDLTASGGTAALLEAEGIKVESVESITGFPSILNGRVKTEHSATDQHSIYKTTSQVTAYPTGLTTHPKTQADA